MTTEAQSRLGLKLRAVNQALFSSKWTEYARRERDDRECNSLESAGAAYDHQCTMGAFVGKVAVSKGKGHMIVSRYAESKDDLPTEETVRKWRPVVARLCHRKSR